MDFSPPSGPPPPKVPAGWTARWNDQYNEWFYVNIYTKKSQWDKPTEAVYAPTDDGGAPPGAPPGYDPAGAQHVSDSKTGALQSNNPYGGAGASSSGVQPGPYGSSSSTQPAYGQTTAPAHPDISEDERLARKLQEEEDARVHGSGGANRGASDSYYGGGAGGAQLSQVPYDQQQLPPRDGKSKGGLFSKLSSKLGGGSSSSSSSQQAYGRTSGGYGQQQPGYVQQGYPPQQQYGGGYPQQGYPPQQYYAPQQQQPMRRQGGGLGTGGALALGAGGGLLGGMMLGEAMGDMGDNGGDYGGGDDGGGGDFGGGDDGGGGDF